MCEFPAATSHQTILMMMTLLWIILHQLDLGLCVLPVLYLTVKIYQVLDAPQGFCEGNPVACQSIQKSRCKNWNNLAPDWFHLLTTPLHHIAIWLVVSSEARIWRHYRQELFEFVDFSMLFTKGCSPELHKLTHIEIDSMNNIWYDNSDWRDVFHHLEDAFRCSNRSIFRILPCFLCLHFNPLSPEYHCLEV